MPRLLRGTVGAAGVAAMTVGVLLLVTNRQIKAPVGVLGWLVGAIAVHDGLLVPSVLAVGALLPVRMRRPLRAGLVVAACLTAVALPVMLRQRTSPNTSVVPLDYVRNWLEVTGVIAVLTAGWVAAAWFRHRRRRTG
jgi:hypothetical protein